jgi:tetratricopeptide (TPR) repeat protein
MKFAALAAFSIASAFCQSTDCDSLEKCQEAVRANRSSSLAHFRMAEIYFMRGVYQSGASEYRAALNGDHNPEWVEALALVNLGKIFDITGQRERALNQYKLALKTNDNTKGALDEANKYLQVAFKPN